MAFVLAARSGVGASRRNYRVGASDRQDSPRPRAAITGFGGRPRGHGGCSPQVLMITSLRVAAVGDLHCTRTSEGAFQPLFAKIGESADVLVLCGDLTDYGTPDEARVLAKELGATKLPKIAVLGNHDFESSAADEVARILTDAAGVTVLDGTAIEVQGVGFAGAKGFAGGFGARALQSWGEGPVKAFVARRDRGDAQARVGAGPPAHPRPRRAAALRADLRHGGRRARRDLSRSWARAASRSRSIATGPTRSSTATPTAASSRGPPRRASRCTTWRCRCCAGGFPISRPSAWSRSRSARSRPTTPLPRPRGGGGSRMTPEHWPRPAARPPGAAGCRRRRADSIGASSRSCARADFRSSSAGATRSSAISASAAR